MSFPRYPKYKDSGVQWLGEVPEHWDVSQSRRLFSQRKERIREGDEQLTASQKHGVIFQKTFMELEDQRVVQVILDPQILKHVEPNDFVISMRSFQGGIELCQDRGCISSAYVMLVPGDEVDVRYFKYAFKSSTYIQALQSTTNLVRDGQALRFENFAQVPLPRNPLSEQSAIAVFLDRETAKIDALVAEQRRLIALLKEKRQAVISHAVTKGLNPHAPMKPSGIEWLGDVPEHWDVTKVKHVIKSIEQGWSPQCEGFPVESPDQWGVLKVGCVNTGQFNANENKVLPETLQPIPSLAIAMGDLLISRANTRELVGRSAVAEMEYPNLLLCDKLYRLRMRPDACEPLFLSLYLSSDRARGPIEIAASGASASMVNIGQSVILEMAMALPSIGEQKQIVDWIREQCGALDTLTAEAERAIDLLQEHRTALISAAVTGKIDVRGLAETEAA